MRIALIYSNQPGNQYAGGAAGVDDSEQAWMRRLATSLAPLLRAEGVDVEVGPIGPDYRTNVAWVNQRHAVKPFDLLISLHSNAMGDACILWGTSQASTEWAAKFRTALNAAAILPYGDVWEFNGRKVSETSDTRPPAVLLEVGQHDRADYAQWLRDGITSGSFARRLAAPILKALGVQAKPADPLVATTPLPHKEAPVSDRTEALLETIAERLLIIADALTVGREGVKYDGDVIARLRALEAAVQAPAVSVPPVLTYRLDQ